MNIVPVFKELLAAPKVFQQILRNAHIFKRRYPIQSYKPDSIYYSPIRNRNLILDHIRNTDDDPSPPIQVYLLDDIPSIGTRGKVYEVEAEYARTKLFLNHQATYATPENIAFYSKRLGEKRELPKFTSKLSHYNASKLWDTKFIVNVNSVNQWTIDSSHINVAIEANGIKFAKENIILPPEPITGPNMDLQGKIFVAYLILNKCELIPTRFIIHHWGQDLKHGWQLVNQKPIFEYQSSLLEEMNISVNRD